MSDLGARRLGEVTPFAPTTTTAATRVRRLRLNGTLMTVSVRVEWR